MLKTKKVITLVLLSLFSQMSFAQSKMCDEVKAEIEATQKSVNSLRSELTESAQNLGVAKSILETAQKESEKYNKPASIALTVGAGVVTVACGAAIYRISNSTSSGVSGFINDLIDNLVGIPVLGLIGTGSGIYTGKRIYKSIVTRDKLEEALRSLDKVQLSYDNDKKALNAKEGFLDGLRDGYYNYCK